MCIISIKGMRLTAHHGVLEQERRVGNTFEVNVELRVPGAEKAMKTDDLADTINYADVVAIIKEEMAKPSRLIEAVAGRIRDRLAEKYGDNIADGKIEIAKLAPPIAAQLEAVSFTYIW